MRCLPITKVFFCFIIKLKENLGGLFVLLLYYITTTYDQRKVTNLTLVAEVNKCNGDKWQNCCAYVTRPACDIRMKHLLKYVEKGLKYEVITEGLNSFFHNLIKIRG